MDQFESIFGKTETNEPEESKHVSTEKQESQAKSEESRTEKRTGSEEQKPEQVQAQGGLSEEPKAKPPVEDPERRLSEAVQAERRRWKERADSEAKRIADLEARLQALQPKPEAPKEPSYDEDPAGWLRYQQEQLRKTTAELEARTKAQQEQYEKLQQQQQVQRALSMAEAEATREIPDYYDGLAHWRQAEMRKLQLHPQHVIDGAVQALGYDPEAIQPWQKIAVLQQYSEQQEAQRLLSMGMNPGRYIYDFAKNIYGYQPKSAAQGIAQPAPAAPAAPADKASAQLARIQEGMAESGSLGGGASASPKKEDDENELTFSLDLMRRRAKDYNRG